MLYLHSSTSQNKEEESSTHTPHPHEDLRQYLDHYCSIDLSSSILLNGPNNPNHHTKFLYTGCMKYLLNLISTGAQREHGMIKENFMINMTVANNKLYYRSLELICNFVPQCDLKKAEQSLLKVIYSHENVNIKEEEYKLHSIQQHIEYALTIDYVIPQAIKIASNPIQ